MIRKSGGRVSEKIMLQYKASERHAGLHEVAAAGQGIGREASRRKTARDRIVVVERVEHVVDAERPEEMVHRAAQLEIDRRIGADATLGVGLVVVHVALAPAAQG